MKNGWGTKKLGEIGAIVRGKGIRRSETVSKGFPCLRYGEIYTSFNIELDYPKSFVPKSVFEGCPHIEHGDLVFTLTGENKEEIAKTLAYLGNEVIAAGGDLAIWKDHGCDAKFLSYVMNSPQLIQAKAIASNGDIIVHASLKKMMSIDIPIPPLSEQKRIVKKIDAAFEKIDALKANAEKNLANAKELFQSALDEAMRPKKGWAEKRLGEVYRFIDYRGKTPNKISSGIPLVTAKNIRMGYIDYSQRDYISEEEFATRQTRGIAHKGDILFTTEAPMGFVAIADLDVFSTGQRVITFQQFENSKLELLNRYYFYHFQAPCFQGEIKKRATGATAQGIKASRLRDIQVSILPITEQREIVKRLDFLSEKAKLLDQNYTKQVADCVEMRQAILREAFEGRL